MKIKLKVLNIERRTYDEMTAHFFFNPAQPLNPGDPPVLAQKTMCYAAAIYLCRQPLR